MQLTGVQGFAGQSFSQVSGAQSAFPRVSLSQLGQDSVQFGLEIETIQAEKGLLKQKKIRDREHLVLVEAEAADSRLFEEAMNPDSTIGQALETELYDRHGDHYAIKGWDIVYWMTKPKLHEHFHHLMTEAKGGVHISTIERLLEEHQQIGEIDLGRLFHTLTTSTFKNGETMLEKFKVENSGPGYRYYYKVTNTGRKVLEACYEKKKSDASQAAAGDASSVA